MNNVDNINIDQECKHEKCNCCETSFDIGDFMLYAGKLRLCASCVKRIGKIKPRSVIDPTLGHGTAIRGQSEALELQTEAVAVDQG